MWDVSRSGPVNGGHSSPATHFAGAAPRRVQPRVALPLGTDCRAFTWFFPARCGDGLLLLFVAFVDVLSHLLCSHVRAQRSIDLGLITLAQCSEPNKHIRVKIDGDGDLALWQTHLGVSKKRCIQWWNIKSVNVLIGHGVNTFPVSARLFSQGGPGGTRTRDPHNAIVVRSQLRYGPRLANG